MPEKKPSMFEQLDSINVNSYTEKKGQFTYLSWAWAVRELLKVDPYATWVVHKWGGDDDVNSRPYMETEAGYFVQVTVTVNDVERTQVHPVLDNRNQSIKEPNAFQINTSIQRCLAKAIALHGLGLYIYAGEDLPHVTPLSGEQKKELLDVATKLGKDKHNEVSNGIANLVVHADNYAVTLKSLERRAKQNASA